MVKFSVHFFCKDSLVSASEVKVQLGVFVFLIF